MRGPAIIVAIMSLFVSVGGLTATWLLAEGPAAPDDEGLNVQLTVFNYAPEEILPDSPESDQLLENHFDLIQKILYEASYGLNATKKPIIHNLLNNKGDIVYCTQNVQGGNLKHLMIDGTYAANLLFAIEYVSDYEYNTYTFRAADAKDNPKGTAIEVYKTVMVSEDKKAWTAPYSYKGVANTTVDPRGSLSAINPLTWVITN